MSAQYRFFQYFLLRNMSCVLKALLQKFLPCIPMHEKRGQLRMFESHSVGENTTTRTPSLPPKERADRAKYFLLQQKGASLFHRTFGQAHRILRPLQPY